MPYFNGYYVKTGEPVICAYPGNPHVLIAYNNGDPMWNVLGCKEGDSVTVTATEPGKYIPVQESMNTVYSNDRQDFPSDEAFANFRAMSGGRMKKDTFFRGVSPVNDAYNRAATADGLLSAHRIQFVLDLSDTPESIEDLVTSETCQSPYTRSLYEKGLVHPLGLSMSYRTEKFRNSLIAGLLHMAEAGGPVYIHCQEGKDRTGFVCMLLEALCGATMDELEADYMKTYENYYGIVPGDDQYAPLKEIKFLDPMEWLLSLGDGSPESGAKEYLLQSGMREEDVDNLIAFLSDSNE